MLPDQKLAASIQRPAPRDQPPTPSAKLSVILFDGQCRLCINSVKLVARLDWLHCFVLRDLHQRDEMAHAYHDVDATSSLDEMHVILPDGRRLSGFFAFREIARTLPLAWPIWPLLYLPSVPYFGVRVYRFIARHRSCKNLSCEIPAQV